MIGRVSAMGVARQIRTDDLRITRRVRIVHSCPPDHFTQLASLSLPAESGSVQRLAGSQAGLPSNNMRQASAMDIPSAPTGDGTPGEKPVRAPPGCTAGVMAGPILPPAEEGEPPGPVRKDHAAPTVLVGETATGRSSRGHPHVAATRSVPPPWQTSGESHMKLHLHLRRCIAT